MDKYQQVLDQISRVASIVFENNWGEVYLFGSQARRDSVKSSDWDLLILINEKMDLFEQFEKYGFPFSEIGWYLDEDINPLIYTKEEWLKQKQTFFYYNVMRDAIKLYS